MPQVQLLVCGAKGRMGQRVVALAEKDSRFQILGQIDQHNASDFTKILKSADAVVEFTTPQASQEHALLCAQNKKPIVIGTTGFKPDELNQIKKCSSDIPIFLSPNMSPAVNLFFHLAQIAAHKLKSYEARITEAHHAHKKDKPSGTALKLAEAVRKGSGKDSVPIESIREGEIVGNHTLSLEGPFEELQITHRAISRDIFALGALEAALWITQQKPGLYDFLDLMQLGHSS
ncbi:MAG: 4-hydroxy-tetrahydrodipicolinate reductase [Elusimicrobia bacterium]|nr:4-hydroxy-tetrahydrodipicolinate reductase [Elusimicrobiota bacterium]